MPTFDTIDHTLGQSSVDALAPAKALTLDRFPGLAGEVNRQRGAELSGLLKALAGVIGLLEREPTAYLRGGGASAGGLDEVARFRAVVEGTLLAVYDFKDHKSQRNDDQSKDNGKGNG